MTKAQQPDNQTTCDRPCYDLEILFPFHPISHTCLLSPINCLCIQYIIDLNSTTVRYDQHAEYTAPVTLVFNLLQGPGTTESTLIEILASRTNLQIKELAAAYQAGMCNEKKVLHVF